MLEALCRSVWSWVSALLSLLWASVFTSMMLCGSLFRLVREGTLEFTSHFKDKKKKEC